MRIWIFKGSLKVVHHVRNERPQSTADMLTDRCATVVANGELYKECPCGEVTWVRDSFAQIVKSLASGDHQWSRSSSLSSKGAP